MFTQHFTPACTSLCRMHTRVYVCVRFLMPQANTPHICTRVRAEHYNTLMVLYRLNGFTRVRVFGFDTEWTWFFFCVSACAFCVCVLMRTRAKGGLNRRVSIKHVWQYSARCCSRVNNRAVQIVGEIINSHVLDENTELSEIVGNTFTRQFLAACPRSPLSRRLGG